MKCLFLIISFWAFQVQAFEVKIGADIEQCSDAMQGYKETALQMGTSNGNRLKFWNVDEGVLIVTYSPQNNKILAASFYLTHGGPKNSRKTFSFAVKTFDTETGELTLQMKKAKLAK